MAHRFADRVIGLDAGKVVFDVKPKDLSNDVLNLIYENYRPSIEDDLVENTRVEKLITTKIR